MIIDCHTHLNRYNPTDPPTLAERHGALRAEMDAHGIGHAMVLTSYDITPDWPSPDDVLAQVADDPRLSVVAGVSFPHLGGDQVGYLRGLLRDGRIRGLKLYPGYQPFHLTDRRLRPIYEMAAEFGVPVMIHTGDTFSPQAKVRYAHPLEMDDVAVDFSDTTFVMCHLGNPWFADAMEVIYKNANVLGDFCGLTLGAFEERYERLALRRVNDLVAYVNDPRKLMFGTDWPISDIGSYLRFTEKLELTAEEREGVLWRNAARVFGIMIGEELQSSRGDAEVRGERGGKKRNRGPVILRETPHGTCRSLNLYLSPRPKSRHPERGAAPYSPVHSHRGADRRILPTTRPGRLQRATVGVFAGARRSFSRRLAMMRRGVLRGASFRMTGVFGRMWHQPGSVLR